MKLWHDDTRPAPDGWHWAKNNREAQEALRTGDVLECSLDHDLGAAPGEIFIAGHSPDGTGYDLVLWMIEGGCVPPKVTIHSWNFSGADRMAAALRDAGHEPVVAPFEVPRSMNWIK